MEVEEVASKAFRAPAGFFLASADCARIAGSQVPSGVVDGSHLVSRQTSRSFIVRTPERASEPGPLVPRQPVRQQDPERGPPPRDCTMCLPRSEERRLGK